MTEIVDTADMFRRLILSTDVNSIVGGRVFWPSRPQTGNLDTQLPCIVINMLTGLDDGGNSPLGTEIWQVRIEANRHSDLMLIHGILRKELNKHRSPARISPGILAVLLVDGPRDNFNEEDQKPQILCTYQLRVAFEV